MHIRSATSRWSTVNAEEAFPGIIKPLTWSFFGYGGRRPMVQLWQDLGVLAQSFPVDTSESDQWFVGSFFGRAAMNVDLYAQMADRMPGTSGAALEEQFFGVASPGPPTSTARRYPFVMVKAPLAVIRARRATLSSFATVHGWRLDGVRRAQEADEIAARRSLLDSRRRMGPILRRHILLTMIAQGVYEQVRNLCASTGHPGLEDELMISSDGTDELQMISDLWDVARDHRSLTSFLDRHGYHGSSGGHLEAFAWREASRPVQDLVDRFRSLPDDLGPRQSAQRKAVLAARAKATVLEALPASRKPSAIALLRMARALPVLREMGKSTFLQVADVGRACARRLGQLESDAGRLRAPDDVFFLTVEELVHHDVSSLRDTVASRRADDAYFRTVDLPESWHGDPTPLIPENDDGGPAPHGELSGLGVSSGVIRGTARVIDDPSDGNFDYGDILVCRLTDPSWSAVLALAGALVIDVGSALSHGAIIARELGIPCVINVRVGTEHIHSGDQVIVDGGTGIVRVVERARAC